MYETQRLARTIALMSRIYNTQHHQHSDVEVISYLRHFMHYY